MKKFIIISLLLLVVLFTGCANTFDDQGFKDSKNFKTLNDVVYPEKEYLSYSKIDNSIRYNDFEYLNNFMNVTTKELFTKHDNYIYSPISLYMALGMLVQGADEGTQKEILTLLQGNTDYSLETINKYNQAIYNHNYYKNDKGLTKMANSIWIKKGFEVKQTYLDDLTQYYYANAYNTKFDDEGKQNIVDWINHNTNNLLNIKKETYPIDEEMVLMLINTLYFDNKWETEFKKSNNYEDLFFGDDEIKVEYMKHTIEAMYYQTEKYDMFSDYFENGNSITYIYPNENSNIEECLNNDALNMKDDILNSMFCELTLSVPKFKTNSTYELNDTLKKLGLVSMFDSDQANFSKITDKQIYVSFVQQDAGIILSEEGVKAAAVTSGGMLTESVKPEGPINVVLNRPFIYIIRDSYNVPLFVGAVYNPEF